MVLRITGAAPSATANAPPAVVVCRSCGIVAPTQGTHCSLCNKPLDETRVQVPAQSADTFWVAVRCGFTCNSCKFLAPLDALDADGAVECAHCGLRQRFEVPQWTPALEFAHAVGDLAGPLPEGRNPHPTLWIGSENPYDGVGVRHAFEHAESGVLSIDAAPGHPVCKRCRVPLVASILRPGAVETRCPTCGDLAKFNANDQGRSLCPSLVAVVADEHRSDRPRAQAQPTQTGVTALKCPSCGAPLGMPDSGGMATCTFCSAACIVPARVRARARHGTPEPDVWWMLFQGVSAKRRELQEPTDDGAPGPAVKALRLIKLGGDQTPIGDAPGVYDAPEVPGIYWPQVAVTAVTGTAAAVLGLLIYELILH